MAPKGKRGRKRKTPAVETAEDKRRKLFQSYLDNIDAQAEEYVKHLNDEYTSGCAQIEKIYRSKLAELPTRYHTMTIEQYMEEHRLLEAEQEKSKKLAAVELTLKRLVPTKKKGHGTSSKKSVSSRRRSLSCPSKNRRPLSIIQNIGTPLVSRNRVLSESTLLTPGFPQKRPTTVTPKFDFSTPLPKRMLRRPRIGETVMSIAGSPVQNLADDDDDADDVGVIVKLGKGRTISITDTTDLNDDVIGCLDENTKEKVKDIQQRLQKILSVS